MSQICSLIFFPSISTVRILKSIPEGGREGGEGREVREGGREVREGGEGGRERGREGGRERGR